MAGTKTQFDEFLAQEIKNCKGVYFPVKAGALTRLLVRKADCYDLHPNPEDEFSMPSIGPNYEIISRYQKQYTDAMRMNEPYYSGEPIFVEKTHPDGYMIINGHHRWAAALRIGQTKIPVKIINLTHGEDIKAILQNSQHTKRAALDLDEVVFGEETETALEKPLQFPLNRLYKERLRLGIPALFNFLSEKGDDIWLYSARYYSTDSIQKLFHHYHVKVDGVITATEKRKKSADESEKKIEKMIANKYQYSVHIDSHAVLLFSTGTKSIREFSLDESPDDWPQAVAYAMEELEKSIET